MRVSRHVVGACVALSVIALAGTPLRATADTMEGGQVNISGATLFADFFASPAATNDFIDVDGDGVSGWNPDGPPYVDQLAPTYTCFGSWQGWWLLQFRGVGSGNGLGEFSRFQLLGEIPDDPPAEVGRINTLQFATGGVATSPCGFQCNPSGTPVCPTSIDLAVMDVPTIWFVRAGDEAAAAPGNHPGYNGYGWSPNTSWDTEYPSILKSLEVAPGLALNTNLADPDENTVFDSQIAWVPSAILANRGTGIEDISISQLKHLFASGRLPSGENLVACTRDPGSGTRNLTMNSIGLDPAWGRGDNYGSKTDLDNDAKLGPQHQATNLGGSGIMETAVQNTRLAVGYTGVAGGSRAAGDALAGKYEIANVVFDDRGGTQPVRPTKDAVLDNCDPDTGWQIGGNETIASRGDPDEYDPEADTYIDNQNAADFLRNLLESITYFEEQPGAPETYFMPGRYLAQTYFLKAGIDCVPHLDDPTSFYTNPDFNGDLQEYIRAHNDMGVGGDTPAYGLTIANKVPVRLGVPDWTLTRPCPPYCPFDLLPVNGQYSDGSTNGNYANLSGAFTVAAGVNLSERNQIAGDFNNDKLRDLNDIPGLMSAIYDPRAFAAAEGVVPGNPGSLGTNYVIPEIIGDFNGDGNFGKIVNPQSEGPAWDIQDARYFADGLAIDPATGQLDRKRGFILVDQNWETLTGDDNFFGTTLSTGKTYAAGDSRGDMAGSIPSPGANPTGADGTIDCADVDYVCQNFGTWASLGDAAVIDLSCDMNGDLVVDQADVFELVHVILGVPTSGQYGDANLDGVVDAADLAIVEANLGQPGCWCDGDFNGNGVVDEEDLAAAGGTATLTGDSNCDGVVNGYDIDAFVMALTQPETWQATYACHFLAANDCNGDGAVNGYDIDPFVQILTGGSR